jgi:hypothetical protein
MALSYKQWGVDDVVKWLESIQLHNLIPMFERHGITGPDLPQMDDAYMRESLRITKPAEMTALRGAISTLTEQLVMTGQPGKGSRKVSNAPLKPAERERTGSFDQQKTYPQLSRKTSNFTPTTMPRNFTVSGGEREIVVGSATREPRLKKGASAPEVLDDRCRYSGWIRKQGGGYKSCEWSRRQSRVFAACVEYTLRGRVCTVTVLSSVALPCC